MMEYGFQFEIGAIVTHRGMLLNIGGVPQPLVITSRILEEKGSGVIRFYSVTAISRALGMETQGLTTPLLLMEMELAPYPQSEHHARSPKS